MAALFYQANHPSSPWTIISFLQVVLRTPRPKKTKPVHSSPKTRCLSSPPYEKPAAKAKNYESAWASPPPSQQPTSNGAGPRSRPTSQTCPPTPNTNYNVLATQVRERISGVTENKTSRSGKPRIREGAGVGGKPRSSGKVIKTPFVQDFAKDFQKLLLHGTSFYLARQSIKPVPFFERLHLFNTLLNNTPQIKCKKYVSEYSHVPRRACYTSGVRRQVNLVQVL